MSVPLGVASVAKASAPRLVVEGINRTLQCLRAGAGSQAVTGSSAASVGGAGGSVSVGHASGGEVPQTAVGTDGVVDWTLADLARAGANLTDGLFTLDALLAECGGEAVPGVTVGSGSGAGDGSEASEGGVLPTRRRNSQPYFMTWWQQLAWTTVFALMLIVAIGGNAIVMWIVLAHRRMRTVTNYFLVNLSVADLMMAVFNCIFNFVYMLNSDWHFGNPYCTVNNFIANVTVAASVFTLTGISFDRYLAIVRPLQPRMSKFNARVTIVVIWVASMVLGFPCLMYSTTITYKHSGQVRTACILVWPDGPPMVSTLDYAYNIVLFVVTYVLPICAMAACYTSMGRELWGGRAIGEMTQRQIDSIRSKRKVVRMFIIIVTIFAVCWLPYHAYFIYMHHHRSVAYTKYVQHLYLAFYWLAMCNSMVNPLIYYWMNARFRQYFKNVVCEWHCQFRKPSRHEGAETPPMMRRYNNSQSYSRSRSGTADDCVRYGRGAERGNMINQGATPLKVMGQGVQGAMQANNCDCCRERQKTVKIATQGTLASTGRPILAIHQNSVPSALERDGAEMSPFLRNSSKSSQLSINSHNHSRVPREKSHHHHHHHRHFLLSKSRKEYQQQQAQSQLLQPNSQAQLLRDKEGLPDQEIEWGSDNASCCGTDAKPVVSSCLSNHGAGSKAKRRSVFQFSMEEQIANSNDIANGNGNGSPLNGAVETTTSTKV